MPVVPFSGVNQSSEGASPMANPPPSPENFLMALAQMHNLGRVQGDKPTMSEKPVKLHAKRR